MISVRSDLRLGQGIRSNPGKNNVCIAKYPIRDVHPTIFATAKNMRTGVTRYQTRMHWHKMVEIKTSRQAPVESQNGKHLRIMECVRIYFLYDKVTPMTIGQIRPVPFEGCH